MRKVHVAVGALLMVASLFALSGCENGVFAQGPASIKRDGVHLLVAVCVDISVVEISGEQRSTGVARRWTTFWQSTGNAELSEGDVITTAEPVSGLSSAVRKDPMVGPGNQIDIGIYAGHAEDSQYIHAGFDLGKDGLSSSSWLHPDGSTTNEPCPS